MRKFLFLAFLIIGLTPIMFGQNATNCRLWIKGFVYKLNNKNDTIPLKSCKILALKDTIDFIKTSTNEEGYFELTILSDKFFNDGIIIRVERDDYISAEMVYNWRDYDRMQNRPENWRHNFEMIKIAE